MEMVIARQRENKGINKNKKRVMIQKIIWRKKKVSHP